MFEALSMSLLRYFTKKKALPTMEETGIGDKPTAEANKRVAEVLEQQRSTCKKCRATAHSEEARVKIGKYASINGTASARRHFKKELDLPESIVRKLSYNYEYQSCICTSYKYQYPIM